MDCDGCPLPNGIVQESGLPLRTAPGGTSSTACDEGTLVCFPLHPRDALWRAGLHTLSEHRAIRDWISRHPLDEDGKVQQSLWYHFGRRRESSDQMVRDSSTTAHPAIGLLSRVRSCEFSPFFRPRTGLTTKLRELGTAVCVDVAHDHGTPCTVAITVESDAGGCWSSHASLACSSKDFVDDATGVMLQELVFKELARLENYMQQSMPTTWKEHAVDDIIRLSVRLSYWIPEENPPVERRVRGRYR